MAKEKVSIFSFFSGAGFLDLGFEMAGAEMVFVNEIQHDFLKTYKYSRKKLGIGSPDIYDNIDISAYLDDRIDPKKAETLKNQVIKYKENNHIVGFIGGPPCPDFSVGGKNRGREGEKGILSSVYADLILQVKPHFFLFENVKGLWKTKKHREYYEELKLKLNAGGYFFAEKVINALEYGVPQDRERIILIGFSEDFLEHRGLQIPPLGQHLYHFPWNSQITFNEEKIRGFSWPGKNKFEEGSKTSPPPNIIQELTVQHWFDKNDVSNHPNGCDFFIPRAGLPKMQQIEEGDDSRKSYKRIHRWRYSPTAAYGNNEVHLHPFHARRISVAEALAIQSLPKEFEMPPDVSLTSKFKMIGNGVPYLAAMGIAKTIFEFINECE